jgi:general secretion pathway protein E
MTGFPPRPELAPLLTRRGFLTQEQIDEARQRTGAPADGAKLAEALITLGLITEDQIHFAVSDETGLPYLHLTSDMADVELVRRFPPGGLVGHAVVPLLEDPEELSVAMVDPWDEASREMLGRVCEKPLNISLAAKGNVAEVLRALLGRQSAELEAASVAAEDATGIALVYQQLLGAASENASQIHFDATADGLRVLFRVGRKLVQRVVLPQAMALAVFTRLRVLAGIDAFERGVYFTRGIRTQLGGRDFELDISYVPTLEGGCNVVSLSTEGPPETPLSLDDWLGSERVARQLLADLARSGRLVGLGLPPGSPAGLRESLMTTAAQAGLKVARFVAGNRADPLPGVLTVGVEQGGINLVRASEALALAPDVVFVPQLAGRPAELRAAIEMAQSGPCVVYELACARAADVFAELHSAAGELQPLLAGVVRATLAVRPVRELCTACRAPVAAEANRLAALESRHRTALTGAQVWDAPGCDACKGTGHQGTALLAEHLGITARARECTREGDLGAALAASVWTCDDLAWLEAGRIGLEELE